MEDRLLKLAALAKAYVALPITAVAWRAVYFSECNSLHQCLLFINTRFFTAFACLITVLFNTFHINDYVFTSPQLVHIVLSISHHNLLCHNLIIYPATLCALSLYIWLFPASFFTLSLLLIDRSRRKTLHTLHCQYHLSTLNAVSQNMDRS